MTILGINCANINDTNLTMYADDINILIMDNDEYVLQRKIEKVIHDLEWWCNKNDLIINVKKNGNYVIP